MDRKGFLGATLALPFMGWAIKGVDVAPSEPFDVLARLNDTYIDPDAVYGDDLGHKGIEDVMRDILDDAFGVGVCPIEVVGEPRFAISRYQPGEILVVDALTALADLIGWSVHCLGSTDTPGLRLTLYDPPRIAPQITRIEVTDHGDPAEIEAHILAEFERRASQRAYQPHTMTRR